MTFYEFIPGAAVLHILRNFLRQFLMGLWPPVKHGKPTRARHAVPLQMTWMLP